MDKLNNRLLLGNMLVMVLILVSLWTGRSLAAPGTAPNLAPLGTAFTYEGRIGTLTGTYDFQFRLFDAPTAGALVGTPSSVLVNDRPITQGEYLVQLNFGTAAFTGEARYLEVSYRLGSSTGAYTLLASRQPIAPVAYALSMRPGATMRGALAAAVLQAENTSTGIGLWGRAINNPGVYGESTSSNGVSGRSSSSTAAGVYGINPSGRGVVGESTSNVGVVGTSQSSVGVYGKSSSSFGVQGTSTSGAGTVGVSRDWIGVYGESTTYEGVTGVGKHRDHGAVVGKHEAGGIAVFGTSSRIGVEGNGTTVAGVIGRGTGGIGVWGISSGNAGVYGQSTTSNAVSGVASGSSGAGVYGDNTAGGYAMRANGNVTQNLSGGGWVKAMAYVDPFDAGDRIKQCYNSQLPSTQATASDCGLRMDYLGPGNYRLHVPFSIVDRFIALTPVSVSGTNGDLAAKVFRPTAAAPGTLEISMYYASVNDVGNYAQRADGGFYVIVY